jgi:hypothetical protein
LELTEAMVCANRSAWGGDGWVRVTIGLFSGRGKKKGRGCYYAPALVRYVALTVRSMHGDGSAQLSRYIHLP